MNNNPGTGIRSPQIKKYMYNVWFFGNGALSCKCFRSFFKAQFFALKESIFGNVILSIEYRPKPKF